MLKLKDGRDELFQWDTNRILVVDEGCSELHFSNQSSGRSIDVEVVEGEAKIPDELLQTIKPLKVLNIFLKLRLGINQPIMSLPQLNS